MTPASAEASTLATVILNAETTLSDAFAWTADHFGTMTRVDTMVAALTTFAPEDPDGWVHLGQRAWLREWLSDDSRCKIVPGPGAGPEEALTMPWMSQLARDGVVVIVDSNELPPAAAQDRREMATCGARSLLACTQNAGGTMYGSLSIVSADSGVWPDVTVADLRLLSAALTSRMTAEQSKRSLAEAIALGDQARASQEQFFAAIGHELRTPISAILGFAEMLSEEAAEQPATTDFSATVSRDTGVILRAGEQLLAIVEDLLSTGRTLGAEEVRADQDVAAAIEDVMHWHRTPALAGRVEVRSLVGPGVTVHARPSGLRQVLTNLIGNAIIHNHPGGSVEISAEPSLGESREPRIRVKVRDTGPGLTTDELARVFEPFVRFAGAEVKGTGLGLPLARAVAERDGGLVGVESTPGRGSVFWVDLPVDEY